MKKALSVVLAILVAFSMFSVVAAAADTAILTFVVDGEVYEQIEVQAGVNPAPYTPANPVKQDTDTTRYTFKGWRSSANGQLYYKTSIPTPDESTVKVTYTAEFSEEDISGRQSFWNLVESIFERINMIFQYFAIIFNF